MNRAGGLGLGLGLSLLKNEFVATPFPHNAAQSAFETPQTELCCITLQSSKMLLRIT